MVAPDLAAEQLDTADEHRDSLVADRTATSSDGCLRWWSSDSCLGFLRGFFQRNDPPCQLLDTNLLHVLLGLLLRPQCGQRTRKPLLPFLLQRFSLLSRVGFQFFHLQTRDAEPSQSECTRSNASAAVLYPVMQAIQFFDRNHRCCRW